MDKLYAAYEAAWGEGKGWNSGKERLGTFRTRGEAQACIDRVRKDFFCYHIEELEINA
jgi:hypothetical protein